MNDAILHDHTSHPLDHLLLRRATRRYATLLHLYPRPFRQACGPDMLKTFRDFAADALHQSGSPGLRDVWRRVLLELPPTVLREHWDHCRDRSDAPRILLAAATLLIPYLLLARHASNGQQLAFLTIWLTGTAAGLTRTAGRGHQTHAATALGSACAVAAALTLAALTDHPVSWPQTLWAITLLSGTAAVAGLLCSAIIRAIVEGISFTRRRAVPT